MYTLGGGINPEQGWGRAEESFTIRDELAAYGAGPAWFTLGDRDYATHILRTELLTAGRPLSEVTRVLCERWRPGVRLLPMTDDTVETHVTLLSPGGATPRTPRGVSPGGANGVSPRGVPDEEAVVPGTQPAPPAERPEGVAPVVHFQEWWVRLHAAVPAAAITPVGAETATPGPGVLEAIAEADFVLFPPSNPVVSIGPILAIPGIREAAEAKTVVGVSGIIGGAPVRGMADACLAAIGVETSAAAVAAHYGPRLLSGWLVDDQDKAAADDPACAGITVRAMPLYMRDLDSTAAIARAAIELAQELG
jgi:LPPG:FO 2-phospho-L-lactate transferase